MHCVAGRRDEMPPRIMEDMGSYRHKVFVDHLGWSLRSSGDVESDEFDGPDAVYVTSQDTHGQVNGVARLLPTTAPYLLERVFPTLWGESELPHSAEVWELSRFAAVDFDTCTSLANQASARHAARHAASLFRQVVRVARECGAHKLVTVSPVGMERLLRINGFHSLRAGPPNQCGREYVVALVVDLLNTQNK